MVQNNFDLDAYLKDLEYLVNIDSGSRYVEGVAKVAEFFSQRYLKMGWKVQVHHFDSAVGPCLEIVNRESDSYDVLLMGHMDTVFPVGTAAERPFTIKDEKAFGPGVNDMKAGLLNIYYVLSTLQSTGKLNNASICVALNCDEEISSKYSRPWLEELSQKSKLALVFEAARTDGNLVNRRKGVGRYKVIISGVAAHSGVNHEDGHSAIQELAHWILNLHGKTNYETGTTVNVGVISGGTAVNVVADKAEAEIDIRFFDLNEAEAIEVLMNNLVQHPKTLGVKTELAGGVTRPPMNPSNKTLDICKTIEQVGLDLGIPIGWTTTGGGSDGCFSANLGIPTIDGLGPVGGGSHGVHEYLEINTIEQRYSLACKLIEHIAEQ